MWQKTTTKAYGGVRAADVWRLWADVNNWVAWHSDLDYCTMSGPFTAGNTFLLKPKGAPEFKLELTEVIDGRKFTDCTKFFGARMYDTHEVEKTGDGVRLTNTLKVTGLLSFIWVKLVAANVANTVPQENDELIRLATHGVA